MSEPIHSCARCGRDVDPEDSYVVSDAASGERVWVCRVEHIVAWVMRGSKWGDGRDEGSAEGALTLTRHRSGTQTEYSFEDPEALRAWASAGGPWGQSVAENE